MDEQSVTIQSTDTPWPLVAVGAALLGASAWGVFIRWDRDGHHALWQLLGCTACLVAVTVTARLLSRRMPAWAAAASTLGGVALPHSIDRARTGPGAVWLVELAVILLIGAPALTLAARSVDHAASAPGTADALPGDDEAAA